MDSTVNRSTVNIFKITLFDVRVLTKIYNIFSFRMFAFLDLYNNWWGEEEALKGVIFINEILDST